ncbi:hypothetical protein LRH25_09630 [Ideonella azotifigens]|uniref:Uncharacterized protein n=1 Tax=Ideonella azotifigens TaxID=513160 RepID=A0ABN1KFR0_9BURK|nr:hypothetical protein [Ideonella azotifigens]MCD2340604.1 hypothetical protein [Ideonella azotifigens]
MVEAHVLVGNPHTRKATLLRCLTGCFNRNVRDIALHGGGQVKLYVRVAALQDSRTDPAEFINEVARSRCQQVAFSLWPEAHPHDSERLPDAQAYLAAFRSAGWKISKVAVLGAHPLRLDLKSGVAQFPNVLHQPVNSSAQLIRQHFGWQ